MSWWYSDIDPVDHRAIILYRGVGPDEFRDWTNYGMPEAEFWGNTSTDLETGCMVWNGPYDDGGYGVVSIWFNEDVNDSAWGADWKKSAHRIAYEYVYGLPDEEAVIMHTCDNRGCVNPNHLLQGSQQDNIIDCMVKGRGRQAKLTPDEVREVRAELQRGEKTSDLAKRYGVHYNTILRIKNRESWAFLD